MIFKKFFAQIILIFFFFSLSSVTYAELQGDLYGEDGIVTEDGETFNVGEFNKAMNDGKIYEAESIYNEWVKRREKMLKSGTQYGIFDAYLKHCYAMILCEKKKYEECIAVEDEILDYLQANSNDEDKNWLVQLFSSLRFKKFSYDQLQDYANSWRVQQEIVNFWEPRLPADNQWLLKEKMELSKCYAQIKGYRAPNMALNEDLLPRVEKVFGSNSAETRDVRMWLAQNYKDKSKYSDAAKLYEEILKSDIEVYGESDEKTLNSYSNLISTYLKLNKYEETSILLNRVVPIAEKFLKDDSKLKQLLFLYQADYYARTRQMQKAIESYERILAMPISPDFKMDVLLETADICRRYNDYSNSLKYIFKARDIYEEDFTGNKSVKSRILTVMSYIYSDLGNNQEALKFAQESFDISMELFGRDNKKTFDAIRALAQSYDHLEQYDKALQLYKESYLLAVKLYGKDSPEQINELSHIAATYYYLTYYRSEIGQTQENGMLGILHPRYYSSIYHRFGITWTKKYIDESTKLFGEKDIRTLTGWYLLASFYLHNNTTLDEAIKIFEMILEEESKILSEQDPMIDASMSDLALAYRISSRWKEAIPLYEKIIEIRENRLESYGALTSDEKMSLFSGQSSIYVSAAELYYKDNNFKDAFRTLERGRTRLLIDSYAEQIVKSSGILKENEIVKLNEYKAGLANYSNLMAQALQEGNEQARFNLEAEQRKFSDEYVQYKKTLQEKYPKYKNVSQANKLDFERDKKILPDDTVFVEYMVDNKFILAFMFDKNSDIHAVKIDASENFLSQCNFYREILAYPNLQAIAKENKYLVKLSDGSYKILERGNIGKGSGINFIEDEADFQELKKNLSKQLGEILLSPLKDKISSYSNLIISPDGYLNNIPFETLEVDGKLAIETFNISYVPSFSVLKLMHETGEKNSKLTNRRDLFAMGNAFYGNSDEAESRGSREDFFKGMRGKTDITDFKNLKWKNLEGTQEEINRVSKLFGTKKIFTEKSASESNLKLTNNRGELSKYRYLLFSTHGIFLPYAPEYSSIVLSQGVDANEDGYVTIGEWMGLNLNSDLVVLSACESGLGEYQVGEGIVGIPYALTIAGNKDTVMSLWKVYEKPTTEFISAFFKKLNEGKSAYIAINETKREFLKSDDPLNQNPMVWAAFVLYGF